MQKNKLKDVFKGAIFGQALGDAAGVQAEFRFHKDFKSPDDIIFPMKEQTKVFEKNDWTDDTDQAIVLLQAIAAASKKYIDKKVDIAVFNSELQKEFAEKLIHWINNGFPELGDKSGQGAGGLTLIVKNTPNYVDDPEATSKKIWIEGKKNVAPNGALMRSAASTMFLIAAAPVITQFTNDSVSCFLSSVAAATATTHYDIRCIISAVFLNSLLMQILFAADLVNLRKNAFEVTIAFIKRNIDKYADHMPILQENDGRSIVPKYYCNKMYFNDKNEYNYEKELFDFCRFGRDREIDWIPSLELDKPGSIGYTYKCLSCAAWAAYLIEEYVSDKNKKNELLDFKKIIKYVAHFGGDADTNCAVVGAVLGAFFGYEVLEELTGDWIAEMPHSEWLERLISLNINDNKI